MTIDTPTAEEMNLVFDAWANSYRKSPYAGCTPNHMWEQISRECMRGIVERGAKILVLVTPIAGRESEYPGVRRVAGYSVSEPTRRVLHWLYVKKDYRSLGVGKQLLAATCDDGVGWSYTHRTRASSRFLGPAYRWDDTAARTK